MVFVIRIISYWMKNLVTQRILHKDMKLWLCILQVGGQYKTLVFMKEFRNEIFVTVDICLKLQEWVYK